MIQAQHLLKPDGIFLAVMLGGDSLYELRNALALAEQERDGALSRFTRFTIYVLCACLPAWELETYGKKPAVLFCRPPLLCLHVCVTICRWHLAAGLATNLDRRRRLAAYTRGLQATDG
jgi:hypothetical protein